MITNSIHQKTGGLFFAFALLILVGGCGGNTGSLNESAGTGGGGGDDGTGGARVTVTNIYSNPKQLGVGDVMFADLNSSTALDFSGVDPTAEFAFGMINASEGSGNFTVAMNGDVSEEEFDVAKEVDSYDPEAFEADESIAMGLNNLTENFHNMLREQEEELEVLDLPEDSFSAGKSAGGHAGPNPSGANPIGASAAVSLGESRSFKVLSSLSSTKSYATVNASAECIGDNVIFYVDQEVSQNVLSDADIAKLCADFDPVVVREQQLFGSLSDVDGNGKVVVLFTPQVNRLGGQGGGIITGFFLAGDLYPSSDSNPSSNTMEILYIMVPDPNGAWGTKVNRAFAMSNFLPSVLPHELQHAINYNEHVFVARGVAENSCLNEGLSHLAEDLLGQGQENPSRYGIYLSSPQSYSVISCSQAGLGNRGGSYLFLRYLYDQSGNGDAFVRRLIQSPLKGIKNLEAAFAGTQNDFNQFGEFFMRFAVALTGITKDPAFSFKGRSKHSGSGQWQGACVACAAEDGRGTVLKGVAGSAYHGSQQAATKSSAVRFFKMSGLKGLLAFNNPSGGEGYAVLIRTK